MREIQLNSEAPADDLALVATEICKVLNRSARIDVDFQPDGAEVIEYDLTETDDPVHWRIDWVAEDVDCMACAAFIDC